MSETHLPDLIRDLAIILVAAGFVSYLFYKLKQPVVLGYLLVGYLVGPHFHYLPNVTSLPSIQVWAEIGVIFLMFSLGLEFSFRKLIKVGGAATTIAFIEIPCMMVLGFLTGFALGWSTLDSLFLGGVISISSTSIIVRTVDDLKLRTKHFVNLVFGVLVFEDLIAILMLVLLTTVAVTREFAGAELLWAAGRLSLFLVVWSIVGIFLLPGFVRHARGLWSDESILIFSVGLCLLMVLLAAESGFSPALGAFMMGSILAETNERSRIENLLKPLKHLFAAIFFVSVGMMFQPEVWFEYPGTLFLILSVTMLGKLIFPTLGALVAGQQLKTAVQTGMSLAQIGEFSFIIATLGLKLKVTGEQLYTIAVSVSILTTFSTPYLMRHSEAVSGWIEMHLPDRIRRRLKQYHSALGAQQESPLFGVMLKAYVPRILINGAFILSLLILFRWVLAPYIESRWTRLVMCLMFSLPFFWGLALSRVKSLKRYVAIVRAIGWVRIVLACTLFVVMLLQFTTRTSFYYSLLVAVPIGFALIHYFGEKMYHWLEGRILGELSAGAEPEPEAPLLPWDGHLSVSTVPPHSIVCGQTIAQMGFKEAFGVLVTVLERGERKILAPPADTPIYPYDKLHLVGTDEALDKVTNVLEVRSDDLTQDVSEYRLFAFSVDAQSDLIGKSLRDSNLREDVGLIVGVERRGKQILNPPADYVFSARDRIWIVGDPEKAQALKIH